MRKVIVDNTLIKRILDYLKLYREAEMPDLRKYTGYKYDPVTIGKHLKYLVQDGRIHRSGTSYIIITDKYYFIKKQ